MTHDDAVLDGEGTAARPPRSRARSLGLLAAVAVVVYGIDQLVKFVVETNMAEGQIIEVLGPVLQWHFVRNPGAAFSIAAGQTWIFTGFALIVIVAIAVVARRIRSIAWATVFGLVLGGVLGNLTDRLFRPPSFGQGHVVDIISTPWLMPAIYNVADMGIVFGMILFVWLTIRDVGLDGRRRTRNDDAATMDDPQPAEPDGPQRGDPTTPGDSTDRKPGESTTAADAGERA